jgi:hypothetical protein
MGTVMPDTPAVWKSSGRTTVCTSTSCRAASGFGGSAGLPAATFSSSASSWSRQTAGYFPVTASRNFLRAAALDALNVSTNRTSPSSLTVTVCFFPSRATSSSSCGSVSVITSPFGVKSG